MVVGRKHIRDGSSIKHKKQKKTKKQKTKWQFNLHKFFFQSLSKCLCPHCSPQTNTQAAEESSRPLNPTQQCKCPSGIINYSVSKAERFQGLHRFDLCAGLSFVQNAPGSLHLWRLCLWAAAVVHIPRTNQLMVAYTSVDGLTRILRHIVCIYGSRW